MMDPVHMSEDETDGSEKKHPPVFRIVESEWMSAELRLFFHQLDEFYRLFLIPLQQKSSSSYSR